MNTHRVKADAQATCYHLAVAAGGDMKRDFEFAWRQEFGEIAPRRIIRNNEYDVATAVERQASDRPWGGAVDLVLDYDARLAIEREPGAAAGKDRVLGDEHARVGRP